MTFLYFAYGSNMLAERLCDRCPSAKPIGIAIATDQKLVIGKCSSVDKSGKATLVQAEGVHTPGVYFEIAESEREKLDEFEGFRRDKPYAPDRYGCDKSFQIRIVATDSTAAATTYLANKPRDGLKPYDWYLALMIAGAIQHSIDPRHVKMLRQIDYDVDVEKSRENRLKALAAMKAAGHDQYEKLLLTER